MCLVVLLVLQLWSYVFCSYVQHSSWSICVPLLLFHSTRQDKTADTFYDTMDDTFLLLYPQDCSSSMDRTISNSSCIKDDSEIYALGLCVYSTPSDTKERIASCTSDDSLGWHDEYEGVSMFWRLSLSLHSMSVGKRRCSVSYRMDDNGLIFCDKVGNLCDVRQHNTQERKMKCTSSYTLDDRYASDTLLKK